MMSIQNSESRSTHLPRTGGGASWAMATCEREMVRAEDGYELATSWYYPERLARGAVLLTSGMAIPQLYYDAFARWLADRGFLTVTFDYRGTGASLHGKLRDVRADLFTWARDTGSILAALRQRAKGLPVTWIGHSLGGQLVPFAPGHEHVQHIVTIATGTGYWRHNARPTRLRAGLLWHAIVPPVLATCGYFPGKRLNMVGDLPHGVMAQWRRWCMHPEYLVGVEGDTARQCFASVTAPLTSISFTDDEMMSGRNTEILHALYTGTHRQMVRLAPGDVGLPRIGHFGFFRRGMKDALWNRLIVPLLPS
ncbi:alpha/beta fold hydrolase [Pendulispora brunnea]|uniref:Alpha/beta fold hydrolase n=1 Tax=Pendulispora brunnea TaxID=2905690 RepID=A0ABZ2KGS8_9BACT